MNTFSSEVAVVGTGPAGLTAALTLALCGADTICTGPGFRIDPDKPDTRTTALMQGSVQLLRNIGVWQQCAAFAAPLKAIRLIDMTRRLVRAPEVMFHARELDLDAFGYNIANSDLVHQLQRHFKQLSNLKFIETTAVESITRNDGKSLLALNTNDYIETRLIAGSDGRNSLSRKTAGIQTVSWQYDQAAIACNFAHELKHKNVSTEFHGESGPFTIVPLKGNNASLVWVENLSESDRLIKLNDEQFSAEIQSKSHGLLGTVTEVGPRACFPLSGQTAKSFANNGIALIGEAAHVIPPIGAQGLNLGFRDAATLADCYEKFRHNGDGDWVDDICKAYHQRRRMDIWSRTLAVDLLNRSLLSDFLPLQLGRGIGLHLLNSFGPLRKLAMKQGLQPNWDPPRLMKDDITASQ